MLLLICDSFLIRLIVEGNWPEVNCLKAFQFQKTKKNHAVSSMALKVFDCYYCPCGINLINSPVASVTA